jgi:hypothetical protein
VEALWERGLSDLTRAPVCQPPVDNVNTILRIAAAVPQRKGNVAVTFTRPEYRFQFQKGFSSAHK